MYRAAVKTKHFRHAAAACFALILMLSSLRLLLPLYAVSASAPQLAEYAAEITEAQSGGGRQAWIDHVLTPNAGQSASDFYVMALAAQGGCDLSAYAAAMAQIVPALTAADSAASKERSGLAWIAAAGEVPAECGVLLDANAEALGIMSRVFALHLVNNGVRSETYTAEYLTDALCALQCGDGGWSLRGGNGDPDVTAMTLQALAPYRQNGKIAEAVRKGLTFLSQKQLASGAYQSYGTENAESTAQVWIALSALGTDALHDSRFIKNGHTVLDGVLQFRVSAGVYAHAAGGDGSALATEQVYLAFAAAQLSHPLYLFRGNPPALTETVQTGTTAAAVSSVSWAVQSTASGSASLATQLTASVPAQTETTGGTVSADTTAAAETTGSRTTALTAAAETTGFSTGSSYKTLDTVLLTTAPPDKPETGGKYPYRIPLTAAAVLLFGGAAVILALRGRRSMKTYLTLAAGFGAVTACIWMIRVEMPAQYYQTSGKQGGTVTMEIRCDVICGLEGSEKYPADGIIMQNTAFSIDTDESALTLLYDAVKAYRLQAEVDGISGDVVETAYVRGIASLYEMDFGDLSGWTYTVNGERPPVGCGAYTLHDGDAVAWLYTINL